MIEAEKTYSLTQFLEENNIPRSTWKKQRKNILKDLKECYSFTTEKIGRELFFTIHEVHKNYERQRWVHKETALRKEKISAFLKNKTFFSYTEAAKTFLEQYPEYSDLNVDNITHIISKDENFCRRPLPPLESLLFTNERLVPITEHERYLISDYGRVWDTEEQWWIIPNNSGSYPQVNIDEKHFKVHRLVAQAFIPNPDNLPIVNHKDENKYNPYYQNLEWCTHTYNLNYGTAIARAIATRKNEKVNTTS